MTYNPDKSEKISLDPDQIYEATLVHIQDGKIRDLVKVNDLSKWTDQEKTAISCTFEVKIKNTAYKFDELFCYNLNDDGTTVYGSRSKIGKYADKYGGVPRVGDKVKAVTNAKGYLSIKLE